MAALAGAGPVLELGSGTGRVAVPLAQRGLAVSGIDASGALVARRRAKPGGEAIPVTMGSFAAAWPAADRHEVQMQVVVDADERRQDA